MKNLKIKLVLMIFLLGFFSSPLAAQTIVDLSGRSVDVPEKIERIVALRGALSMVCYLNLADRVVGVEHHEAKQTNWIGAQGRSYRMANPHLGDLPIIGSRNKPLPEKIIATQPDIIILGSDNGHLADQIERQTSVPVIVVESGDLGRNKQRFYRSIQLIGAICGVRQRSHDIVQQIDENIAELARRTKDIPPHEQKTVYVGGLQFKVAHGTLGTACNYPPFQMVNARNVVDDLVIKHKLVRGRFTINKETFVSLDPDVLFICASGIDLVKNELNTPVYREVRANRLDQVYLLMPHYYAADPATVLSEAWYVGKILYPERFQDIEIETVADQLYSFFVGRPLYVEMAEIFGGFKRLTEDRCPQ